MLSSMGGSHSLFLMQSITFLYFILVLPGLCTNLDPAPYELIHSEDAATKLTVFWCRDSFTANNLSITTAKFWLNRTSVNDPDLRERSGVQVIEDIANDCIKFNLTRNLEGNFTCGRRIDRANVQESPPKVLICK